MASDPLGGFFDAVRDRAVANALDETADAADRAGGAVRGAADAAEAATEKAAEAVEGWASALDDFAARAKDVGKGIGDALVERLLRGAEDAVGEFVKTGKLDMRDLVTSMLADLAQGLGPALRARRRSPRAHRGARAASARPSPACCTPAAWPAAARRSGSSRRSPSPARRGCTARRRRRPAAGRGAGDPAARRAGAEPGRDAGVRSGAGRRRRHVTIMTRDAESFRQSRTQVASDIARAVAFGRRGM